MQVDSTSATAYTPDELASFVAAFAAAPRLEPRRPHGHHRCTSTPAATRRWSPRHAPPLGRALPRRPRALAAPITSAPTPAPRACPRTNVDLDGRAVSRARGAPARAAPRARLPLRRGGEVPRRRSERCYSGQNWGVPSAGFVISDFDDGAPVGEPAPARHVPPRARPQPRPAPRRRRARQRQAELPLGDELPVPARRPARPRRRADATYGYSATEPIAGELHRRGAPRRDAWACPPVGTAGAFLKHRCADTQAPWFTPAPPRGPRLQRRHHARAFAPSTSRPTTAAGPIGAAHLQRRRAPAARGAASGRRGRRARRASETSRGRWRWRRWRATSTTATPPTVRLAVHAGPRGRVAVVTAHDDVGLGALVVTSGAGRADRHALAAYRRPAARLDLDGRRRRGRAGQRGGERSRRPHGARRVALSRGYVAASAAVPLR